jgi:hypothetical protein
MKKTLVSCLALTSIFAFSVDNSESVYAASSSVPDKVEQKFVNESATFTPLSTSDGSSRADTLPGGGDASGPYWHATYTFNDPLFGSPEAGAYSNSWTSTSESSRMAIDRIYAKARLYNNGGIYSSKVDDNTNSSYAGAVISNWPTSYSGTELYTNHIFQESGYQSWYPEGYDDSL